MHDPTISIRDLLRRIQDEGDTARPTDDELADLHTLAAGADDPFDPDRTVDILPRQFALQLGIPHGSTYREAAAHLLTRLSQNDSLR